MGTLSKFRRDLLPQPAVYYREEGLKLHGGGSWRSAVCPFHEDTEPSLRINMVHGGFQCHGCDASGGGVLDFHMRRHSLDFKAAANDLGAWEVAPEASRQRDRRPAQPAGDPVKLAARRYAIRVLGKDFVPDALHVYRNEGGTPLYWVIRARHPLTGVKWIRPMRRNGNHYVLGKPEFESGTPLYGLELLSSRKGEIVVICEGEKCADSLRKRNVLAMTSGSATSAARADWLPLTGRDVLIWPDHDEPGQTYAEAVVEKLAGIASAVQVIDSNLLILGQSEDAVDWLKANPAATAGDILALPLKGSTIASVGSPDLTLHPIDDLLDAEVETIAAWISTRCVRQDMASGAMGPLYRDFCDWHGPDFSFAPSQFAEGLGGLGFATDSGYVVSLALMADLKP